MSATGKADAGTTLVEALVVVAITGLLAAVGFPRLQQSLDGFAQRQAAAGVVARLRQVRADALRLDAPRLFAVSADGRGYAASGWPYSTLPRGVSARAGEHPTISFFGDGSSSGGSIAVGTAHRSQAVVVVASTGAVFEGR